MLLAVCSVFAAAALSPLAVRLLGRAAKWVLALVPASAFILLAQHLPTIVESGPLRETYAWLPAIDTPLSFYLDGLSLLFSLLVTGIGTLIVLYGGGYLGKNEYLGRFFVQLFSFMGAMLGLVLADDVIAFFIFFELTSLTSYLLIGFYHNQESSRVAARKALVVTGTGGLALLAGLVLLAQVTGTYAFSEMLSMGDLVTGHPHYLAIFILVCAGAFTKSAQFPFHFWLPAAMAGPTPVSAYLHSATMVKAGVFLLARLSPILGGTEVWTVTLVSFGAFTMLLTAWLALKYTDLKQILAYTTTMVLGLLTMLLGVGTEEAIAAMVTFTVVHALYKGGLFMMAGSIDHETGTRDVRELGGLRKVMPYTMAGGLLTALSMSGLPPLFGFIGKEIVYEAALHTEGYGMILLVAGVLANAALVGSGLVVGIKPFFGEMKGAFTREPHEAPVSMWIGPALLGLGGLAFGLYPAFIDHSLLQAAQAGILQDSHELHLALWHGFNPAFFASLVTFALGFGLYFTWARVQPSAFIAGLSNVFADGPARVFERFLYETSRASHVITDFFQNGSFRTYLRTIFVSIVVLIGGSLLAEATITLPSEVGDIQYYELALAGLLVLSAIAAVRSRDRFVAILALSVGGYSVALLYLLFGAPDLAMTQFSVETLSLIMLVIVLIHLPGIEKRESALVRARDGVIALAVGVTMTLLISIALTMPFDYSLTEYFAANSYSQAFGKNIVNVILVDFRGIDTMGEITVLAMAALGVYALMRMPRIRRPELAAAGDGQASGDAAPAAVTEPAPGDDAPDASGDGDGALDAAPDGETAEATPDNPSPGSS